MPSPLFRGEKSASHGDRSARFGATQSLGANLGIPVDIVSSLSHEVAVAAQQTIEARPRMRPCRRCGYVYRTGHRTRQDADGYCLNATACARHIRKGY
jgi:hypothetical protein